MEFGRIWVLRGPNVWARSPAAEAEVKLGHLLSFRPDQDAGFRDRVVVALSQAGGRPAPDLGGPTLAHTLCHITCELLSRSGTEVGFSLVRPGGGDLFRVVVPLDEEALTRA